MDNTILEQISNQPSNQNVIVYYHQQFRVDNSVYKKTHSIFQMGSNRNTSPDFFHVYDSSFEKLISYNARIIHNNKTIKSCTIKDLSRMGLSNKSRISTANVYIAPIDKDIKPGDLIEVITEHELAAPFLGLYFSLEQIPIQASNITCSFEMPANQSLHWQVENDTKTPTTEIVDGVKTYTFHWNSFTPQDTYYIFEPLNTEPTILAQIGSSESSLPPSWKDFGDQYINLVKSKLVSDQSKPLAQAITKECNTDKEKMDAIVSWCRDKVRYEQDYLEKGEIIPHDIDTILYNKYGDCKDYASLIFSLAKSLNLDANLALVYRGRENQFFDFPVSQFNHMLVHYNYNGQDIWYDGTNRRGRVDITNIDLINKSALVIRKNNSEIKTIDQVQTNLLDISGDVTIKDNDLTGQFTFTLSDQFAIPFLFSEKYYNTSDYYERINSWLHKNITDNFRLHSLNPVYNDTTIQFICDLTIQNCFVNINDSYISNLSRIFNMLFPADIQEIDSDALYYYPYYNRVNINLDVKGYQRKDSKQNKLLYSLDIHPGPFTESTKNEFIKTFQSAQTDFTKTIQFFKGEVQ